MQMDTMTWPVGTVATLHFPASQMHPAYVRGWSLDWKQHKLGNINIH